MPFQSERQRRFMWMHHPEIARRWAHKYGSTPVKSQAIGEVRKKRKKRRKRG